MNHIAPGAKRYSSTCPRSSIGAPNKNWNYFGDFRPGANTRAAEMRQLPLKGMYGADDTKGGSILSEVIPFPPKPPSKSIEEETAEFLKLLERIRSSSQKPK
jgi:hypothetical protein